MIPLPKNYLQTYWPFNFVRLKSIFITSTSSHYPASQRSFLISLRASLIASKYKFLTRTLEYDPKSRRKAQGRKRKSKNRWNDEYGADVGTIITIRTCQDLLMKTTRYDPQRISSDRIIRAYG